MIDIGPDSESEVLVSQWNPHVFGDGEQEDETTELLLSEDDQGKLMDVLVHMSPEDRERLIEEVNHTVYGPDGASPEEEAPPTAPSTPGAHSPD